MPTNPTTITHGGERYVRLVAVLMKIDGERKEQIRRRAKVENVSGREAEFYAYSYAAIVVRDIGSALIEEYGDSDEAKDYVGSTDAAGGD